MFQQFSKNKKHVKRCEHKEGKGHFNAESQIKGCVRINSKAMFYGRFLTNMNG